jgi:uncharacterized membrane protein YhaH (DUF805 family)
MWNSVAQGFSNYAVFGGRATRAQYWWFYLFLVLVNVPIYWLADAVPRVGVPLSWVWAALTITPFLAVMSRRLHDTGHSLWWGGAPFLAMLPVLLAELLRPQLLKSRGLMLACFLALLLGVVVLMIRLLVLLCSRGDAGVNRYGAPAPATSVQAIS